MRKHVSIFAFLLGAFATVFQVSAEQTVEAWGWWLPGETEFKYIGDQSEKLITPEAQGGLEPEQSVTFTAKPKTGWTVDHWQLGKEYISDDLQGEKISGTEGQIEYVWRYNAEVSNPVLAVKFRWLTYDLECKADERVVFSQSEVDYPTTFQIGGTVSPTIGKRFLNKWKDLKGNVYEQGASVTGDSFPELSDVHTDIPNRHVVTLTALWETNTYTVAYALEGGKWPDGASHPESVEYFKTFAVTDPVKDGFTFVGWKLSTTGDIKSGSGGKTEFENLVAENGGSVTLAAQWSAKFYTVTLLHPKSYPAADSITVTYGETPGDLTPPRYDGGDQFGGYFTEQDGKGVKYWDEDGKWIGPNGTGGPWTGLEHITLHAYVIVNNWRTVRFYPNGGSLSENERKKDYYVGRKFSYTDPLPIPTWEGDRYVFGGWKVAGTGELITNDSIVPAGAGDLTLEAEKSPNSYFISFEPNGATDGRMEVQELKFDVPAPLKSNEYGKTGYRFKGWSKSAGIAAGLPIDYMDGQEVLNLAAAGLETNSLYAVWETNRYWVAFEPNGGTGNSVTNLFLYDQPQNLPSSDLFAPPSGFWRFSCWSNTVSGLVWTNECAAVTNLTAANGATVVIKAVWKTSLSDLALAMDCDNLNWSNVASKNNQPGAKWSVAEDGYESESCAKGPTFSTKPYSQCLTSSCITNDGTLSFTWKPMAGQARLALWINGMESFNTPGDGETPFLVPGSAGVWTSFTTNLTVKAGSCLYVHLLNMAINSDCYIDQMTWIPERLPPGPGDAVEIKTAAVSDGKFVLSFESDEKFDYNLLTNANLLIDSWGVMGEKKTGDGNILTFEPQIIEGQPQLFYKVETIQRKD